MKARPDPSIGDGSTPSAMPDISLASRLFDAFRSGTSSAPGAGVTRASYGEGEALAHTIVRREAEALGLQIETDSACNLYMTMPGADTGPRIIVGSHLDSVPNGGNYDGAAGVLAGLAVVSGLIQAQVTPPRDITVMAIRAEESAWFGSSYIGSRAAFGLLTGDDLDTVIRAGDGLALGQAIAAAGGAPATLREGAAFLHPSDILCFIEPHIEQGPILINAKRPIGIVTGIRGSFRYRHAFCRGSYAHSGATPRHDRQDAIRALAELVTRLDALWQRLEDEGADLTVTFGQVETDPKEASFSKVAGLARFSLDIRSSASDTLDRVSTELARLTEDIAARHRVRFELGPRTGSDPAQMHDALGRTMLGIAREMSVDALEMPCGAGHDAATFASMGVPTGMIFLRNANGSHNPDEHMEIADFGIGAELLMRLCLQAGDGIW